MLVRTECACGQTLEVDTTLAAPLFSCPKCGRSHEVLSSGAVYPVVSDGSAGSDQAEQTENRDRAWVPVVGTILAVLLICFALLWALLAHMPGGQGDAAGQGGRAGAGNGVTEGSLVDSGDTGKLGDGTPPDTSRDGRDPATSAEDTDLAESNDGATSSEPTERLQTRPFTQTTPSTPAKSDTARAPADRSSEKPVDDSLTAFAADPTKVATSARQDSTTFNQAKWGRPERSDEPESASKPAESGRSGRSRKAGRGTKKAGRGIFDKAGSGRRVVYVIDYSGSMSGERLAAAKRELVQALQKLKQKNNKKFYVIFYDDYENPIPEADLLPATKQNIDKAIGWIERAWGGGGTDPTEAMMHALRLKPDTIWLLSDGCFIDSICDVISAANSDKKVSINTIAFHDPIGQPVLRRIAKENKGDYRFVPGPRAPCLPIRPGRRTR